jgi:hypothetical protein
MTFDTVARERCKAKVNKQALPTKYFNTYVVYKYNWCEDTYCVGFDMYTETHELCEEFKKRGVDADIAYGYPFEHMNPEKKSGTKIRP